MPITILDYVKFKTGEKPVYTPEDAERCNIGFIGDCQICEAALALYNAYPSLTGYWQCAGCIGGTGFDTVEDFDRWMNPADVPPGVSDADLFELERGT